MLPSESQSRALAALASHSPEVQKQASILTKRLMFFNFPSLLLSITEGPVVRTFVFEPLGNVRFSLILAQSEELAGALGVESVTTTRNLGNLEISVPRGDRQVISFDSCLHTMMKSPETASMQLPLLLGQNKIGEFLYADLVSQPHLLIAGATNSGKSVFTAQLICSLALFCKPSELEFTLVDTKNLDLVLFKGLEHVKYVLSSVDDIRAALKMLLEEVRLRNIRMSGMCRNIKEWNAMQSNASSMMPYKVVIMDELADVVDQEQQLTKGLSKKECPVSILELLKTIAQISRAAGVHLILATQRPSVDILPGSIKTNFSARISFKLPTRQDSQVILDENGAENLLGKGDYLYKIAGSDTLKRAHSSYVSITDIATITAQHEQIRRMYKYVPTNGC